MPHKIDSYSSVYEFEIRKKNGFKAFLNKHIKFLNFLSIYDHFFQAVKKLSGFYRVFMEFKSVKC